jgi:hypothetical protein
MQVLPPVDVLLAAASRRVDTDVIIDTYLSDLKLRRLALPKVIVVEIAKTTTVRANWSKLGDKFKQHGYKMCSRVLRCDEHGIPHAKAVTWLIAVLQGDVETIVPQMIRHHVPLDMCCFVADDASSTSLAFTDKQQLLASVRLKARNAGIHPNATFFIDASGSRILLEAPSITSKRAADGVCMISTKDRCLDVQEMLLLHGFPQQSADRFIKAVPRVALLDAIGRSGCVNIYERIAIKHDPVAILLRSATVALSNTIQNKHKQYNMQHIQAHTQRVYTHQLPSHCDLRSLSYQLRYNKT